MLVVNYLKVEMVADLHFYPRQIQVLLHPELNDERFIIICQQMDCHKNKSSQRINNLFSVVKNISHLYTQIIIYKYHKFTNKFAVTITICVQQSLNQFAQQQQNCIYGGNGRLDFIYRDVVIFSKQI